MAEEIQESSIPSTAIGGRDATALDTEGEVSPQALPTSLSFLSWLPVPLPLLLPVLAVHRNAGRRTEAFPLLEDGGGIHSARCLRTEASLTFSYQSPGLFL